MVRRVHVINALIFLVFMMIIINLYGLVLLGSSGDIQDSVTTIANINNNNISHLYYKEHKRLHKDEDQNLAKSIRFLTYKNGTMTLEYPSELENTNTLTLIKEIQKNFNIYYQDERIVRSISFLNNGQIFEKALKKAQKGKKKKTRSSIFDNIKEILALGEETEIIKTKVTEIVKPLKTLKIIKVENPSKMYSGTQLKLQLELDSGIKCLFKPRFDERQLIIPNGDFVYSGKDRFYGEILSFALANLLGFEEVTPPTMGREIDLINEVLPHLMDEELKKTFYFPNDSNNNLSNFTLYTNRVNSKKLCFYGNCYYCKKDDPACSDTSGKLEGAIIIIKDFGKKQIVPNPWRRIYNSKNNDLASWQKDVEYCQVFLAKKKNLMPLLLDIISVAIFDFIIGNGDRHRLEILDEHNAFLKSNSQRVLLIDNGKSFGNSQEDYIDILSPLYHCCKIRSKLYDKLLKFKLTLGQNLKKIADNMMIYESMNQHYMSINRRLILTLSTIDYCITKNGYKNVLL